MTLNANELYNDDLGGVPAGLRVIPAPGAIQPKTFAAGSGTLAKLTPVVFNPVTEKWQVWSDDVSTTGEGDEIAGFTWPDEITLDSDEEVLGNVLLGGQIHFDDIAVPSDSSSANLQTALRTGMREKGFIIQGLTNFR